MQRSSTGLAWTVDGPAGAPVLVLGSSLGTTHRMWDPQVGGAGDLTRDRRVVRYDHLGHGDSAVPAGPYTIDDLGLRLAGLVDEVCTALDVERLVLGGLSLGGMLAQWVAAHRPEHLAGAVLCCTSACAAPAQGWLDRAALVRAEGTAVLADVLPTRWFTPEFAAARPDVPAWASAMVRATPDEGYAACCEAIAGMDLRPALAQVPVPVAVLIGAQDPATPPEHSATILAALRAGRCPEVTSEVVPAAHLASVELPERVSAFVHEAAGRFVTA